MFSTQTESTYNIQVNTLLSAMGADSEKICQQFVFDRDQDAVHEKTLTRHLHIYTIEERFAVNGRKDWDRFS